MKGTGQKNNHKTREDKEDKGTVLLSPSAGQFVKTEEPSPCLPLSLIGSATLTAIFDISGRTAMATDAGITGSGQNGWTYDYGTTRLSGNKAYGTACFKSGSTTKSMTLTLTCSPDGAIS